MSIKVLLIEDEVGIRTLVRKIIEKNEGFSIVGECDNSTEGIKLFNKLKPDVVFLDVQLREGDGLSCASILRQNLFLLQLIVSICQKPF